MVFFFTIWMLKLFLQSLNTLYEQMWGQGKVARSEVAAVAPVQSPKHMVTPFVIWVTLLCLATSLLSISLHIHQLLLLVQPVLLSGADAWTLHGDAAYTATYFWNVDRSIPEARELAVDNSTTRTFYNIRESKGLLH